jgi:hypothetical protein
MKPVPAATHRGRGVATKGVTAKQTLTRIRVWRLLISHLDISGRRSLIGEYAVPLTQRVGK